MASAGIGVPGFTRFARISSEPSRIQFEDGDLDDAVVERVRACTLQVDEGERAV